MEGPLRLIHGAETLRGHLLEDAGILGTAQLCRGAQEVEGLEHER